MTTLTNLSVTTDATALPTHFFFLESTSKGPPQPGALYLTWKLPNELRSSERFVWAKRERYADCVAYNRVNAMNVIVTEVKQDQESAEESQHNEHMVGL